VKGIDFTFVVQVNGLNVERGGFDRVCHASSLSVRSWVKVKGS
jgi:hypothetical protein